MNEYKNPETMKSVIEYIEDDGDAVFREVFRNRLWFPIMLSASLVCVAVAYLFLDENPVSKTLDIGVTLTVIIMVWGQRYMRSQIAASESKYAHALSYLDSLEDEPDA
jgi:hypothetical protein